MPSHARPGEPRFLDPAATAGLGPLELKGRPVVEGFRSGLHRSPFKGFSVGSPKDRADHLRSLLVRLDRLALGNKTDVSKPLHLLADGIVRRGMVVVISDLLDDPERVVDGLRHFRFRGTDVIVFHLLDPDELTFPFERAARFRDMEIGYELMAVPSLVRADYLAELERTIDTYKRDLSSAGIDYRLIDTSEPLEFALMSYLSSRSRTM